MATIDLDKIKSAIIKKWYIHLLIFFTALIIGSSIGQFVVRPTHTTEASFICTMSTTKQAMTIAQNGATADQVFVNASSKLENKNVVHQDGKKIEPDELRNNTNVILNYDFQEVTIIFLNKDYTIVLESANAINEAAVEYLNTFPIFNMKMEIFKSASSYTTNSLIWLYYGFAFAIPACIIDFFIMLFATKSIYICSQ